MFRRVDGPPNSLPSGWVLAALDRAATAQTVQDAFGTLGGTPAAMINIYVPYTR